MSGPYRESQTVEPHDPPAAAFDREKVAAALNKTPLEAAASDLKSFLGDVIPATFVVLGKIVGAIGDLESPHCHHHHHHDPFAD